MIQTHTIIHNHYTMAKSDYESELLEASTAITTPFSIAAGSTRSTVSSRVAKYTILDHRASLKGETIELLECLEPWFRIGIFTEEDLYAIVGTMGEGGANALDF